MFLALHNLSFAYNSRSLFSNINLEVEQGECVVVMGRSGCGKSTLLRVLMGVEQGANGELEHNGTRYPLSEWNNSKEFFSIVTQSPHLLPWKTLLQNVQLANKMDAEKMLAAVGLSDAAQLYPHQVSLGMASRAAFARSLALGRRFVLLDEPFAALDAFTRRELQLWFVNFMKEFGTTCLLVTHDIREALQMGQKIYILGDGSVLACYLTGSLTLEQKIHLEQEIFDLLASGRN